MLLLLAAVSIETLGNRYFSERASNPYTGLDRSLGLQEVEATRISRQSAHEGGKVVSPLYLPRDKGKKVKAVCGSYSTAALMHIVLLPE